MGRVYFVRMTACRRPYAVYTLARTAISSLACTCRTGLKMYILSRVHAHLAISCMFRVYCCKFHTREIWSLLVVMMPTGRRLNKVASSQAVPEDLQVVLKLQELNPLVVGLGRHYQVADRRRSFRYSPSHCFPSPITECCQVGIGHSCVGVQVSAVKRAAHTAEICLQIHVQTSSI